MTAVVEPVHVKPELIGKVYEVDLPMMPRHKAKTDTPCPPLSENDRLHFRVKAPRVKRIREEVMWKALAARIPKCNHLTVQLFYRPGTRQRMDEDNLAPNLKAACDALARGPRRDWVGLELVPDDTAKYMTKERSVIVEGAGARRLWITVRVDA
jgi:crossover junction endodeoxyribonuclease RusA